MNYFRSAIAALCLYPSLFTSELYARHYIRRADINVPCKIEQVVSTDSKIHAFIVEQEQPRTIERVIDGDTFVLSDGERVRLIGMDCPEVGNFMAKEATECLENLLRNNGPVTLIRYEKERKRDIYGRLLLYVFAGDKFVNKVLVDEGLARECNYGEFREYTNDLRNSAKIAKSINFRIWTQPFNKKVD